MFSEKVRNFIVKLQGLSDTQKKVILFAILAVFGSLLAWWWVVSSAHLINRINNSPKFDSLTPVDLSGLNDLRELGNEVQSKIEDIQASSGSGEWQNYANEKYGFEVKYPSDWIVINYPNNQISFTKPDSEEPSFFLFSMYLTVEPNPKKLSAKEFVLNMIEENKKLSADAPGKITYKGASEEVINGTDAYKLDDVFVFDQSQEWIYFAKDENILKFDFPVARENPNFKVDAAEYNKICHDILATLAFTNQITPN